MLGDLSYLPSILVAEHTEIFSPPRSGVNGDVKIPANRYLRSSIDTSPVGASRLRLSQTVPELEVRPSSLRPKAGIAIFSIIPLR
jgi:hypothetical protein